MLSSCFHLSNNFLVTFVIVDVLGRGSFDHMSQFTEIMLVKSFKFLPNRIVVSICELLLVHSFVSILALLLHDGAVGVLKGL